MGDLGFLVSGRVSLKVVMLFFRLSRPCGGHMCDGSVKYGLHVTAIYSSLADGQRRPSEPYNRQNYELPMLKIVLYGTFLTQQIQSYIIMLLAVDGSSASIINSSLDKLSQSEIGPI